MEKELAKLVVLDRKLIDRHDLYKRKMELKKISEKSKKYQEFLQEYLELRLKVGQKRLNLRSMQLKLMGDVKGIKIDECNLKRFMEEL